MVGGGIEEGKAESVSRIMRAIVWWVTVKTFMHVLSL